MAQIVSNRLFPIHPTTWHHVHLVDGVAGRSKVARDDSAFEGLRRRYANRNNKNNSTDTGTITRWSALAAALVSSWPVDALVSRTHCAAPVRVAPTPLITPIVSSVCGVRSAVRHCTPYMPVHRWPMQCATRVSRRPSEDHHLPATTTSSALQWPLKLLKQHCQLLTKGGIVVEKQKNVVVVHSKLTSTLWHALWTLSIKKSQILYSWLISGNFAFGDSLHCHGTGANLPVTQTQSPNADESRGEQNSQNCTTPAYKLSFHFCVGLFLICSSPKLTGQPKLGNWLFNDSAALLQHPLPLPAVIYPYCFTFCTCPLSQH